LDRSRNFANNNSNISFWFVETTEKEMSEGGRRMNRTLTQRYDMNALRALQKLESQLVEKVCQQMGIEEDDLEIEVDLLRVYNMDASQRETELKTMFATLPGGPDAIVAEVLEEFSKVESLPK
jgi:hypothetical protein